MESYDEAQRKKKEKQPIVRPWVEAARNAFAGAFAGNPEGRRVYEEGRSAIVSGLRPNPNALTARQEQRSPVGMDRRTFAGDVEAVGNAVRKVGEVLPKPAYGQMFENRHVVADESRKKRLEMAGYPSEARRLPGMPQPAAEAPVMSKSQTEGGTAETRFRYEGPPEQDKRFLPPPIKSGEKSRQSVTGTVAAQAGMPVANSDPRKRYLDMANMSLEQREEFLNKLPVGQRPIQVIRGNQESWYSPGMSREFATIPEAMSGIQGRPTYQSEEDRSLAEASRGAMSARQQALFAHQKEMKQGEYAQEEKMAKEYGAGIKGGRGKGEAAEDKFITFKVPKTDANGNITEEVWWGNPRDPAQSFPVKPDAAPHFAAQISRDIAKDESSVKRWAEATSGFDLATFAEIAKAMPEKDRALFKKAWQEMKDKEKK